MKPEHNFVKVIFGLIIFLFSSALAYFIASYLDKSMLFDYWLLLTATAIFYVIIGLAISSIYSVSLGFLFSSDVLLINILAEKYGTVPDIFKTAIVGIVLLILYIFAWIYTKDKLPPETDFKI